MASNVISLESAKAEFEAAAIYHEKTGRNFFKLSPTQRRKLIEEYVEKKAQRW